MKKILLCFLFLVALAGCNKIIINEIDLDEFIETINIPTLITNNIDLPDSYQLNNQEIIAIWTSSNRNIINDKGEVTPTIYDEDISLHLLLTYGAFEAEKTFNVTVVGYGVDKLLNDALATIVLPLSTKENISLPYNVIYLSKTLELSWSSNKPSILSPKGKVTAQENDTVVILTCLTIFEGKEATRDFEITVKGLTSAEKLALVFEEASPPSYTTSDLILPTSFAFSLTGTWSSSHPDIISDNGIINPLINGNHTVTLTLTLNTNDRRTYEVIVSKLNHMVIDQAFLGRKDNLEINNKELVLSSNALSGEYNSGIINTLEFSSAVASWAATSSKYATVELEIQFLVGSTWSKYFSYGKWGQGLQNKVFDTSDSIAKLNDDIITILNNKKASAIRFKATLRRDNLSVESPRLALLACALEIPGYSYPVNTTDLPREVDYNVPKLYQHVVPTIGGSICSPTSSTMLLKYKGHDFKAYDTYEHRYIANIVKEYNSGIFGNWVYNTVGISSFGEISYVARMYSAEELVYHLATVGPVSASIKGTFIGELGGRYTTNGHLIVVRGYRYVGNQLYFLINDPNLSSMYDEVRRDNFLAFWRNIVYVIL